MLGQCGGEQCKLAGSERGLPLAAMLTDLHLLHISQTAHVHHATAPAVFHTSAMLPAFHASALPQLLSITAALLFTPHTSHTSHTSTRR